MGAEKDLNAAHGRVESAWARYQRAAKAVPGAARRYECASERCLDAWMKYEDAQNALADALARAGKDGERA